MDAYESTAVDDPAVGDAGVDAAAVDDAGEPTVEQMLADDVPGGGLREALAAIRQTAGDGGITVTVDVYGKIVALRIDQHATRRGATALVTGIQELTAKAAAAALTDGLAAIAGECDPAIVAGLADHLGLEPAPTR